MKEFIIFTRDAFKAFLEKPVVAFLYIALVFYLLYFSLWVFCPCG
jgi:hypothetical protein